MPRPPRRAVRGLNGVTDMNQIVEQPVAERPLASVHRGGERARHPHPRRPALRRAGARGARHPRRAADHAHPAGAARDRRQPQPARPHRHRDRPAPPPASAAAARRHAAHVRGHRAGRRALRAAGGPGARGAEPPAPASSSATRRRCRAEWAELQHGHLPAVGPPAGGARHRRGCSRSAEGKA